MSHSAFTIRDSRISPRFSNLDPPSPNILWFSSILPSSVTNQPPPPPPLWTRHLARLHPPPLPDPPRPFPTKAAFSNGSRVIKQKLSIHQRYNDALKYAAAMVTTFVGCILVTWLCHCAALFTKAIDVTRTRLTVQRTLLYSVSIRLYLCIISFTLHNRFEARRNWKQGKQRPASRGMRLANCIRG